MSKDHAMLTASNSSMISYGGGDMSPAGFLIMAIGFIISLTLLMGSIVFIIHGIFWDLSWVSWLSNNYFSIHDSLFGLILIPLGIVVFFGSLFLAFVIDEYF